MLFPLSYIVVVYERGFFMQINGNEFQVYEDMNERTGGELYIGIVGPVRTGKSTFMKRFMEEMVLPNMTNEYEKSLALDELPQSAGGRTITTTEPKFIPKDAAQITVKEDLRVKVRLVDCVGFMVDGATGHMENEQDRMVKTPWFSEEIPFTKAALVGTRKVMQNHATIGIVIITDGSFIGISRDAYEKAEVQAIEELKALNKPFIVLLNSSHPEDLETRLLAEGLEKKYHVTVLPVDCTVLKKHDFCQIMNAILYEFPLTCISIKLPQWFLTLPVQHPLKESIIDAVQKGMVHLNKVKDLMYGNISFISEYIDAMKIVDINLSNGVVTLQIDLDEKYYFQMLSELCEQNIEEEYQLYDILKQLTKAHILYTNVASAMEQVKGKGYSVIMPDKNDIDLEKPELIKQGTKYGVKIKAESPSIHMIKANIETEIAPIVGSKQQAEDLIQYILTNQSETNDIWDINIFGKTVEQLVQDGMQAKIAMINDESQMKLQETMQKIVNDCNGGMVCIII